MVCGTFLPAAIGFNFGIVMRLSVEFSFLEIENWLSRFHRVNDDCHDDRLRLGDLL